MKPTATGRPRLDNACAMRNTPSLRASGRRSPCAASNRAVRGALLASSVTCAIGKRYLVPDVVLARGARHWNTLHLFEGRRVIDHQRAVVFPDRNQRVAAVFVELDMRRGLARLGSQAANHLERALIDDRERVLLRAH